ncbi:MAG: ATP-dependent RecD-like DNA helicase [Lachnospiraceae bacterium]|jgi:exodeoxyribonuclease V alpha subunit|nr:ATP-dependent RecD-like DNA helicase [Lachnospiraceae bacterium]RKJ50676.1 ATP-dependent RecD-like DNA helicase [bacterium 1XD42-54]
MERLEGYIDHIIFRNSDNGYTVMVLVTQDGEVTCTGTLSYIGEGEKVALTGQYIAHPSYGEQFKIESYSIQTPEDEESAERYLGSGAIKGVGAALAARIVRHFGGDTFRIIEEEPERLAEIKGISDRKAREIAEQVYEKRDMRKAMIFLQQLGITTSLAVKIYEKYGAEIYRVIQENPYQLADDIGGVGFRIADEIAMRAGIQADSEYRVKCAIFYVLQQAGGEGHVFLPKEQLSYRAAELLGVPLQDIDQYLMDLAVERRIVVKQEENQERVYSASSYFMEMSTARMLCDLNITGEVNETVILHKIAAIEAETGTYLDEKQKEAVIASVRCGLLVITGGPGTGKTTTINTLISYFESEGLQILLAAPTGRAAKRMAEATGYEAKTIHRLLEISGIQEGSTAGGGFERNAQNPLDADVIIVDEMSMVDIYLMHALLDAITVGTRLIMVGDRNQLPSVGPGSVLKDIIESGKVPVVRLTRIFRQASESDIVVNAHKINRGEHVSLDNKSRDFFFLKRSDANVIISIVIQLVRDKMPRYVDATAYDIQVLTPMRKGLLGVERLNRILQEYLNPPDRNKREHEQGGQIFREGDKVMQIKNNYQIEWEVRGRYGIPIEKGVGVFNGDLGVIREINLHTERITVEFDEQRMVEYPYAGLEELDLAYAVTIHKSQGSEYPAVVIPLLSGPRMLMNRNLLYTAVTRARKCVTVVGDVLTFDQMIDNTVEQKRFTTLDERIRELADTQAEE